MHFQSTVYRALNPIWTREPLSGAGAARFGGRFNPKRVPALYCSLSPVTAMNEAQQAGQPGHFQPVTLISCDADFDPIFDGCDTGALAQLGLTPSDLARNDWRDQMRSNGISATQQVALDLIKKGYHGLLVPSFSQGATMACRNLVLWKWGPDLPTRLTLVDDEGRLTRGWSVHPY